QHCCALRTLRRPPSRRSRQPLLPRSTLRLRAVVIPVAVHEEVARAAGIRMLWQCATADLRPTVGCRQHALERRGRGRTEDARRRPPTIVTLRHHGWRGWGERHATVGTIRLLPIRLEAIRLRAATLAAVTLGRASVLFLVLVPGESGVSRRRQKQEGGE